MGGINLLMSPWNETYKAIHFGGDYMSEQEKKIMATFEKALPLMTEQERRDLLNFSEGMAFMAEKRQKEGS